MLAVEWDLMCFQNMVLRCAVKPTHPVPGQV